MVEAAKPVPIVIHGAGEMGRALIRLATDYFPQELSIVAVTWTKSTRIAAELIQDSSIYREWPASVDYDPNYLIVGGKVIPYFKLDKNDTPSSYPWKELGDGVAVINCTGKNKDKTGLEALRDGAKVALLSAPSKGKGAPAFLMDCNHLNYQGETEIDGASCTTAASVPSLMIMKEILGIDNIKNVVGFTDHARTGSQAGTDGDTKDVPDEEDISDAWDGSLNTVISASGATKTVGKILPEFLGKYDLRAVRNPNPTGSLLDLAFIMEPGSIVPNAGSINGRVNNLCAREWKRVVEYSTKCAVSSSCIGKTRLVFHSLATSVQGEMPRIDVWYDNITGYDYQLLRLANYVGRWKQSIAPANLWSSYALA